MARPGELDSTGKMVFVRTYGDTDTPRADCPQGSWQAVCWWNGAGGWTSVAGVLGDFFVRNTDLNKASDNFVIGPTGLVASELRALMGGTAPRQTSTTSVTDIPAGVTVTTESGDVFTGPPPPPPPPAASEEPARVDMSPAPAQQPEPAASVPPGEQPIPQNDQVVFNPWASQMVNQQEEPASVPVPARPFLVSLMWLLGLGALAMLVLFPRPRRRS